MKIVFVCIIVEIFFFVVDYKSCDFQEFPNIDCGNELAMLTNTHFGNEKIEMKLRGETIF